jgi:branched-subunit amino acid ABC-type transport system permease component
MSLTVIVVVSGITTGCFYALVGLGLQITYSTNRMLNFAQGDIVVGGMFLLWTFTQTLHLPAVLALLLLLPVGFVGGALYDLAVFRPLARRPLLVAAQGPIAAGFALRGLYAFAFGANALSITPIINKTLRIGGSAISAQELFVVGGLVVCVAALFAFMRLTWTGRAMRATAQNREGASVVGISNSRMSTIAVGISGAVSAFAGGLVAPILGISFDEGLQLTLIAFVAAVLGGLDSPIGIGTGALFVGLVIALAAAVNLSAYTSTVLFVVLLVAMFFRGRVFGAAAHA